MKLTKITILLFLVVLFFGVSIKIIETAGEIVADEIIIIGADSIWNSDLITASSEVVDSSDVQNLIKYAFVSHTDSVLSFDLISTPSDTLDSTDIPPEKFIKYAFVSHADTVWGIGLGVEEWEAPSEEPDFWIEKIRPVQVVWDSKIDDNDTIDLVAEKSTMARVEVGMENYEALPKDLPVEVQLTFEGKNYFATSTIEQLEQNNAIDFYPDIPVVLGGQTIIAIVDPENKIEEVNETNNEKSIEITVKDTREISVIYMRIERPEYGATKESSFVATGNKGSEFLKAVYPISDLGLEYEINPIVVEGNPSLPLGGGVNLDVITMHEIAKLFGFDRAVGIAPYTGYLNYHKVDWVGKTFRYVPAGGVVLEDAWTTVAHEIGHTYGLRFGFLGLEDEPFKPINGFWVTEKREIENWACLMSDHIPPLGTFERDWICNGCYKHLFKEFRIDKKDPEILVVSGIAYKDGSLESGRWFKVKEGIDDLDDLIPGDYLLQILDEEKSVIQEVSFGLDFSIIIDSQEIERDSVAFSFAIPYPHNADSVRILYEEEILTDVNLNLKLREDTLNKLPWYYSQLTKSIEKSAIQRGIKNSLTAKLTNGSIRVEQAMTYINQGDFKKGQNMLNSASNIVQAFINEVSAQKGKHISETEADAFINWAQKTILTFQDFLITTL